MALSINIVISPNLGLSGLHTVGLGHACCEWLRLESCGPEKLAHSHVLVWRGKTQAGLGLEELGLPTHLSFSLWSFQLAGFKVTGLTCLFRAHVSSLQEAGQAVLPSLISL